MALFVVKVNGGNQVGYNRQDFSITTIQPGKYLFVEKTENDTSISFCLWEVPSETRTCIVSYSKEKHVSPAAIIIIQVGKS